MAEEKFDYSFLSVTKAREKEILEQQAEWAQGANVFAPQNDRDRMISRGRDLEKIARANIETLHKSAKARKANPHQLDQEYDRLAEGLALQGRYPEAIKAARDKSKRREYRKILRAINTDDSEKCKCPREVTTLDSDDMKGAVSVTPRYVRQHVISFRHNGDLVPLVACSKCDHWNVRAVVSQLAKTLPLMDAAYQQAQSVPQHVPGVYRDEQVLKEG